MLIEMVNRKYPRPHAILFADTGGEKPHTYEYLDIFNRWLAANSDYPQIETVFPQNRKKERVTLEGELRRRNQIPPVAFGWKTCSQRFKIRPQERWCARDPLCKETRAAGRSVVKLIGYNIDELWRARFTTLDLDPYFNEYPLLEWEIGKKRGVEIILEAGLVLPGKSACFFCPNAKKLEIDDLATRYPGLLTRALDMEAAATLTKIKGLGRRFSWRDYIDGRPMPETPEPEQDCGCYDGD